jgi:hypothetical protein
MKLRVLCLNKDVSSIKQCRHKGLSIINKLFTNQHQIKKPSLISERVLAF